MSGTDKHTSVKASYTAAEQYRQTADEHVRTLKDFWKDFLVSGLFVMTAIVIIFACLAWFAANNSVSATGSTISAKGARFTLKAEGAQGVYENRSKLDSSDAMNVTTACNLNNAAEGGELGPGSSGVLTFTVQPLADDLGDIEINLSRCFATRGESQVVVTDETQDKTLSEIRNLLSGHVLFFKSKNEGTGYYSDPVLDGTITVKSSSFRGSAREAVPVTLYWVWPELFQNFVLTGSINYSQNLFEKTTVKGYQSLLDDINGEGSWNKYFQSKPARTDGSAISASQSMTSDDLQTCSDLYNQADEAIGSTVQYVQIRFSATEDRSK